MLFTIAERDVFIWFVLFIWLVSFNQTDQISQSNQPLLAFHVLRFTLHGF
jgi:hypothetical protein